jgi:hypothetical protein
MTGSTATNTVTRSQIATRDSATVRDELSTIELDAVVGGIGPWPGPWAMIKSIAFGVDASFF